MDVYERIDPSEVKLPFTSVWSGPVGSDNEVTLNLELQKGVYILTGPLPPQDQIIEKWKEDEMFHVLRIN